MSREKMRADQSTSNLDKNNIRKSRIVYYNIIDRIHKSLNKNVFNEFEVFIRVYYNGQQ